MFVGPLEELFFFVDVLGFGVGDIEFGNRFKESTLLGHICFVK